MSRGSRWPVEVGQGKSETAADAHSRMDRSCGVILTVLEDCPTGWPGLAWLGSLAVERRREKRGSLVPTRRGEASGARAGGGDSKGCSACTCHSCPERAKNSVSMCSEMRSEEHTIGDASSPNPDLGCLLNKLLCRRKEDYPAPFCYCCVPRVLATTCERAQSAPASHRRTAQALSSSCRRSRRPLHQPKQERSPGKTSNVSTRDWLCQPSHAEARGEPSLCSLVRNTRLTSTRHQYSVLIMGLDNAGKTTFLGTCRRDPDPAAKTRHVLTHPFRFGPSEKVKSTFNRTPDKDPASIAPTIGQNSKSFLRERVRAARH